jgi:uncharacterized SAM-binding protein YcdF (DUF218 family)
MPLGAAAGALLWRTRARWAIGAATFLLAVTWLTIAFTPVCRWLARDLVRRDAPRPADAVFVLSSEMQRDGDPTSTALARLVQGIELIGQGHANVLVLSEIHDENGSYATLARQMLAHLNLHPEVVVVGPVLNTHDEAVDVAQVARARGWRTILLVTSPAHSRRASATFAHVGLDVVSAPCRETRYDMEDLSSPGERLAAFSHLAHERVGLWIYRRRGWI